jgi:uncharacterized membrane protein
MNQFSLSIIGPVQVIFLLLVVILPLVIYIFYNISLQRAMNAVSSKNRKMEGGLIWLNLIPILNIVWPFIFNAALRTSYKNEFNQKGISHPVNLVSGFVYPGAQVLLLLLYLIAAVMAEEMARSSYYGNYSGANSLVGFSLGLLILITLVGLASLVFWIIFWVNANGLRTILENHNLQGSNKEFDTYNSNFTQSESTGFTPPQTDSFKSESILSTQGNTNTSSENKISQEPIKQLNSIDKIKKYHDMLNEGLITQADFDRIKNELLNQ